MLGTYPSCMPRRIQRNCRNERNLRADALEDGGQVSGDILVDDADNHFFTTIYPQHALNRQLSEAAIEDYLRPISSDPQTAAKANLRCSTNDKQAARFNFLDEDQPLR
jgi:hypothetical protein